MKVTHSHPLQKVLFRETKRIKHNPAYRFLLFTGPLLGIILLFFIFEQGTPKELPVAIVDRDNSSLSNQIKNAVEASPDVRIFAVTPDVLRAEKWLQKGQIQAFVLLPKELEKNTYCGLTASVPLYINGTNVTTAGVIQRSLLTTLETISGKIQLQKLALSGKNLNQSAAQIMPVKLQKHVLFNPYMNYSYFLNSAMMFFMLFLFAFMSSVYTFGNELKRGTGKSLLAAGNNSVRLAVAGKIFPYSVIFSVVAIIINFLLYEIEGMPLNGQFLLLFFGQLITIISYQFLGLLFVAVIKNLRLALSVGSAYMLMGITFSGITFPIEGMPKFIKVFTALFPFTWWEKLFISQSLRGAPLNEALPYLCFILLFLVVGVASLSAYKSALSNSKYWGNQ